MNSRTTGSRKRGQDDLGIQRRHEPERSAEIKQYVRFGYPWSSLSEKKRKEEDNNDLRKPGWLPTAIVVNVLGANDLRHGKKVAKDELIKISERPDGLVELNGPKNSHLKTWSHSELPPMEVIDGQHRLWAFDKASNDQFELPVVLFHGLDLSWQAYLFYTINIKPKKINASLAFDLYPLLRAEDWLTKFEGHVIYREARAQELVDLLWSHQASPWYKRINMLGESGQRGKVVTQAAWVRALLATFVRSYDGPGIKLGGLYGSMVGTHDEVLPWSRLEQAAFLIFLTDCLRKEVFETEQEWAYKLRRLTQRGLLTIEDDPAFYGEFSLLSQDQGIRAFLHVANDIFYLEFESLALERLLADVRYGASEDLACVSEAITKFRQSKRLRAFATELCEALAQYDWRAVSAPNLTEEERLPKTGFRGSGGYKELRTSLLKHLSSYEGLIGQAAELAMARLGYK